MSQLNNEVATSKRSHDMKYASTRKELMSRRFDNSEESHQGRDHKAEDATELKTEQ